jgi:hypothetical protein
VSVRVKCSAKQYCAVLDVVTFRDNPTTCGSVFAAFYETVWRKVELVYLCRILRLGAMFRCEIAQDSLTMKFIGHGACYGEKYR